MFSQMRSYFLRETDRPVFVFGHQKSGTTAVAGLFAHLAGLSYSHDMFYRNKWNDNHKLFTKTLPIAEVIKRNPREFRKGLIKDPDLTFQISELGDRFPDSQFVFVARDPFSNIVSILPMLKIPGDAPADYDFQARGDIPLQWKNVLSSERLGLPDGGCIETLARRWSAASKAYFENTDRCALIRYEDFVANKEQAIINLAETFNFARKKSIAQILDKQFQPAGKKISDYSAFFGSQNYETIARISESEAEKLGYSVNRPKPGEMNEPE